MATSAITALATITLASAQATVTFSNIPATGYRDLRIVVSVRSDSVNAPFAQCRLQFNADTGSNYAGIEMTGDGSSAGSYAATVTEIFVCASADASSASGNFNQAEISVMDYMATNKHKSILGRNGAANSNTRAHAGRWANTSAITSVKLFPAPGYGNFAAGSTFSLYGIVS